MTNQVDHNKRNTSAQQQSLGMRSLQVLTIVIVLTAMTSDALAVRHGFCGQCKQFVVLSQNGAGFIRDWKGPCGRCKMLAAFEEFMNEDEQPVETMERLGFDHSNIAGIRYLTFEDGTVIDLKHFFAAAETAIGKHSEVLANILGWGVEVSQVLQGDESGHPFGGNEDLQSNYDGANFGDDYISNTSGKPVGEQVLDYLQGEHGAILETKGE